MDTQVTQDERAALLGINYKTTIDHNGSKWAGQDPDSLETLCDLLRNYALDPSFEEYHGNFITSLDDELVEAPKGTMRFWGNFLKLSHVFSIDSNDPAVIEKLTGLIRLNQKRLDYQRDKLARERAKKAMKKQEELEHQQELEELRKQKDRIEKMLAAG